jgi:hypothetical protein
MHVASLLTAEWRMKAEQTVRRTVDAFPRRAWIWFECFMLLGPIVFCAAAFLYLAACGWALYNGYASFAAWPLRHIETVFPVYSLDARLGAWLTAWAIVAWAALVLCVRMQRPEVEQVLRRLDWLYRWLGLPAVMALFLFHLGCAWAAPEQIFYNYCLGGHVPFSDASGHYQLPILFTSDGVFHEWIMRRPLAAVMRLGFDLLAGWNPQRIITLQTVLLGLSAWLLGLAVLRRWGVCAAVVACSFVFLLSKKYLPSFLVEPLGMIWACLTLALCLDALYVKSRVSAFCALAALTITLLIRMGAMFLPPAVLCWILVRFWNDWRRAVAHACLGLMIMGLCLGASQTISAMYSNGYLSGANFAYTLAALSFNGKSWSTASARYKEQLAGIQSEKEQARFLYAQAWDNIRREPTLIITAMAKRLHHFVKEIPRVMRADRSAAGDVFFWLLTVLACRRVWQDTKQRRLFWLLIMAGMMASAAVTYYDAGKRVLIPGYLFLGVFLAGGLQLSSPDREGMHHRRMYQPALILGGLLLLLMLSAPALAGRFPPEAVQFLRRHHIPPPAPDETLIWGGGCMTGVLVVPDNAPLPVDVPAVSLSSFVMNIQKFHLENDYQPLVTPHPPEPPFAFILGIPLQYALIAPPDMLRRADVPVWRVHYTDWQAPGPGGTYWKRAVAVEPLGTSSLESF